MSEPSDTVLPFTTERALLALAAEPDAAVALTEAELPVFAGCTSLKTVTVLSPNCELYSTAFALPISVKIFGYAPSSIKDYADENGNEFVDLNEDDTNAYYAGTFSDNTLVYSIEKATGIMTLSGSGEMSDYSLTNAPAWIEYKEHIKSLVVEDGIQSIGDFAFYECYNLSDVRFSSTLSRIGNSAFAKSGIQRISLPAAVDEIGKDAFYLCNLKKIEVNKFNPSYLSKNNCLIEIATGILLLGSDNSRIPSDGSAVFIADRAFAGRTGLTEVFIPEPIIKIGSEVFDACPAIESINVDSNNQFFSSVDNCLIDIESNTLIYGCKNSVIPEDDFVTKIGDSAFSSCVGLTEITIPDTIVKIGDKAFFSCSGIEVLEIPSSVTEIGSGSFGNAIALNEVIMYSEEPPVLGEGAFGGCESLAAVFVPKNSVNSYESAPVWAELSSLISEQCEHSFVKEVVADAYFKSEASCISQAVYYKSCECGKSSEGTEFEETFEYGSVTEHAYDCKKPSTLYRKAKATTSSPAIYYMSCACGEQGSETFAYGDKLPASSGTVVFLDRVKIFPDSIFTVNVNIKNNPEMAFLSVTLDYDKSLMTLISVDNGTVFPTLDSGRNLVWSADENCSDNGMLATLTFELQEGVDCADIAIDLILNEMYDLACEPIDIAGFGGMVVVDSVLYGDANGDETVSSVDVLLLRKYMANLDYDTGVSSLSVKEGADANGDGAVNSTDVLLLRKYMANYDYETGTSNVVLGP